MREVGEQVRAIARKYIWWREPPGAHRDLRMLAQVMELGSHEDVEAVRDAAGDDILREVLRAAEPGWFSEKSWHYWHYALGVAAFGQVPDLPRRRFA
jgi:hypothetical protein